MNSKNAVVFSCTYTPAAPLSSWSAKKKTTWAKNRRFYSCNATTEEIDVMGYMLDSEKTAKSDEEYLREQASWRLDLDLSDRLPDKSEARSIDAYMTRFNTLGAFNLGGAMTQSEIAEWRKNAQKTKATLYHGILSLPTWQSELVDYEGMEKLVRQTFGGFLENAGFDPDNVALMCAMHTNTENKHIHFTFYEKAPLYRDKNGKKHFRRKWNIDKQILNEYRMSATAYLDEHKQDLYNYRNAAVNGIRRLVGVPNDQDLYISLCALADKLPKSGRLQYNSDNIAPYRAEIDAVAMMLLRKSPDALDAHNKTLSEIARRGKALAETGTKTNYAERLTAEYRSRLGNVVLGMVKNYRTNPKSAVRGDPKTCKQHKANTRRRREHGARVIQTALRMVSGSEKTVQADFRRELAKAERDIEFEQMTTNNTKHNRS